MRYNDNANGKERLTKESGGKKLWHFPIFSDGAKKQRRRQQRHAEQPAGQQTGRRRNRRRAEQPAEQRTNRRKAVKQEIPGGASAGEIILKKEREIP